VDSVGNLYIGGGNRVRKVDTAGIITTVVGKSAHWNAEGSYSGDGGPAMAAAIDHPWGLAFDSADNLYIADTGNCRVRKIGNVAIPSTITADLTLKLRAPKTVKSGKILAYAFTVTNKANVNVPDLTVNAVLGDAATYTQLPTFCGTTDQNLTCQLGTLAKRKGKTFTVKVKPNGKGTLNLSAMVSGQVNDSYSANNQATASTIVK
jgi:hypothetical protein